MKISNRLRRYYGRLYRQKDSSNYRSVKKAQRARERLYERDWEEKWLDDEPFYDVDEGGSESRKVRYRGKELAEFIRRRARERGDNVSDEHLRTARALADRLDDEYNQWQERRHIPNRQRIARAKQRKLYRKEYARKRMPKGYEKYHFVRRLGYKKRYFKK